MIRALILCGLLAMVCQAKENKADTVYKDETHYSAFWEGDEYFYVSRHVQDEKVYACFEVNKNDEQRHEEYCGYLIKQSKRKLLGAKR